MKTNTIAIVQRNKKEKKDYGNGIKNKCAPYCKGDTTSGKSDYISKDDKCACSEGLIEVIDNQNRKRCEKECKVSDGKNYTEWLDRGLYCKTPDHLNQILSIE